MEIKKPKDKPPKPKQRFTICCFCLNSSSSDVDLKVPIRDDETYDYVVEKLAIKKVPISLFATDEDLAEMRDNVDSGNMGDYAFTEKDKKSAMIFSSCYAKIPKNGRNLQSDNQIRKPQQRLCMREANDKGQETITDVTNEMSSYKSEKTTNNSSDIINISAEYRNFQEFPTATEYQVKEFPIKEYQLKEFALKQLPVKEHIVRELPVKEDVVREIPFKEFPVSAEVHSEPTMNINTKKFVNITPELQETLQELGAKQKPRGHPGVKARIVPRSNNEIKVANEPPMINNIEKSIFTKPTEQVFTTQMEVNNEVSHTLSFHQRLLKRLFSSHQHKSDNNQTSEEKILSESVSFAKPSESNDLDSVLKNFTNKSSTNQKWKIIIKEHEGQDNNMDKDEDATTQQESTDTSTDYSSETDSASESED